MGAWGTGSFDNDDALDWVSNLEESEGNSAIEDALDAISPDDSEYIEAPECSMAIAAAEVIAALGYRPSRDLPDNVREWVRGRPIPDERLRQRARDAITRILRSSEFQELWAESPDAAAWTASLQNLQERLSD